MRVRPSSVVSAAPKGKDWSLMKFVACGGLLGVSSVVVYMFRFIHNMHLEQQAMRNEIQVLSAERLMGQSLRSGPSSDRVVSSLAQQSRAEPDEAGAFYADVTYEDGRAPERRKLSWMASTGTTTGVGCYEITDSAAVSYTVSSATACGTSGAGQPCPDCFVTNTLSQNAALTINGCSTAQWVRSVSRSGIWVYTFINPHATYYLSVTDNSGSGSTTYNIPPGKFVQAYCASSLGTTNRLYFPSGQIPTLTVDSGLTLTAGNFDASSSPGTFATSTGALTINGDTTISGSKTFATGTGAITLNGNTAIAATKTFTVGTSGAGGAITLYGDTTLGAASPATVTLTVNGNIAQAGTGTFSTATGQITLNGDVAVASGMDIAMDATGAGTFTTGTGAITLNGNVAIPGTATLTTGTGDVTFNANTYVLNGKALTVGSPATAGATSTFYAPLVVGGTVSGKTQTLTVYGGVSFNDGADGSQTFSTATGAITINGDTTVSTGVNLQMVSTSTGIFQTGAGNVRIYGDTTQYNAKTFATGTGAVTLNGPTTVADNTGFNVGSNGNGGATQLFGTVLMGGDASGASSTVTIYGSVTINNDANGATLTGLTVAGTGTSSFAGNLNLGSGANFEMNSPGGGTFSSGTGAVTLRGDVTVSSPYRFMLGSDSVTCSTGAAFVTTDKYCIAR